MHDGHEAIDHDWLAPRVALERQTAGTIQLLFPTIKTLELLARFGRVADAMEYARSPRPMPAMAPRSAVGRAGTKLLVPGDYAYAEIGKLDPDGKGTASYEIVTGVTVQVAPRIRRLTAPNPGAMTGPGTNTYLLGDAASGIAVIDPGPLIDSHVDAILDCRRREDRVDPLHPFPRRPFAGGGATQGAHRRDGARDAREVPGTAGSDVRARSRARARRAADDRRLRVARPAHAGSRVEPALLPRGGRAAALHRRPSHAGVDGRDQPARRRHGDLPRQSAPAARRGARLHRARSRLPDGPSARDGRTGPHPPPGAREQGARAARRARARRRSRRSCRTSTTTSRPGCIRWRAARCSPISSSCATRAARRRRPAPGRWPASPDTPAIARRPGDPMPCSSAMRNFLPLCWRRAVSWPA